MPFPVDVPGVSAGSQFTPYTQSRLSSDAHAIHARLTEEHNTLSYYEKTFEFPYHNNT